MKKSKIFLGLLSLFSLAACTAGDFLKITVKDHFDILLEDVQEYVLSGNLVDVVLKYENGANVGIRLDGKAMSPSRKSVEDQYAVVTFKMPDHDVVVQTTIDGCFTDKCEEGHHNFVSHVSEVNGKTYYECTICGYIYHD